MASRLAHPAVTTQTHSSPRLEWLTSYEFSMQGVNEVGSAGVGPGQRRRAGPVADTRHPPWQRHPSIGTPDQEGLPCAAGFWHSVNTRHM